MKLSNSAVHIERGGQFQESSFGLSEENAVHIVSILRDKLYTNKILAVIREYTTNAVDAHIEAGKGDVPIKVSLPNHLNNEFVVRDYGEGLSEQDIREVYAIYGVSTKRNSNNVVGQLGLGCKAAFAYKDQFTITSWYQGVKSIYSAYLDETGVGKIALLYSCKSDDPSGIEIKISVDQHDRYNFVLEAQSLFDYFDVFPDCSLKPSEKRCVLEGEVDGTRYEIVRHSDSHVIMGGVPYRTDLIGKHLCINHPYSIDIYVPIGTVDISANREFIEDNKHTKANLIPIIKKISLVMEDELIKTIEEADSYIAAHNKYCDAKAILGYEWDSPNRLYDCSWNGYKVGNNKIHFVPKSAHELFMHKYNNNHIESKKSSTYVPGYSEDYEKGKVFVYVDEFDHNWKKEIKLVAAYNKFVSKENDSVLLNGDAWIINELYYMRKLFVQEGIKETDVTAASLREKFDPKKTKVDTLTEEVTFEERMSRIKKELEDKGYTFVKYSDIKLSKKQKDELSAARSKEKISTSPAQLDDYTSNYGGNIYKLKHFCFSVNSENWEKLSVKEIKDKSEEEKVYVPIFRYKPEGKFSTFEKLQSVIINYNRITGRKWGKAIYGVKRQYVEKLDDSWIKLEDYLQKEMNLHVLRSVELELLVRLSCLDRYIIENFDFLLKYHKSDILKLPEHSTFRRVILTYSRFNHKIRKATSLKRGLTDRTTLKDIMSSLSAIYEVYPTEKLFDLSPVWVKTRRFLDLAANLPNKYPLIKEYFENNNWGNRLIRIKAENSHYIKDAFVYIEAKDIKEQQQQQEKEKE